MAKNDNSRYEDLLSSVVSEIKTYSGKDSLLPWLRGIKKMKESLPPQMLNEKLPRFLQKCAESFRSDRVYRNDSRYIRVWLQLMDYVDDPKALLRTMEENQIGTKRSLFYQAYALYYEKIKKYEEAEKMYRIGVQNLAEPVEELQKSYEQFLHRLERHNKKKTQRQVRITNNRHLSGRQNTEKSLRSIGENSQSLKTVEDSSPVNNLSEKQGVAERQFHESRMAGSDDTVVAKFVDTAIVGKSHAEDACHHGLVDPTINMKEAMNAINSMFKEHIETGPVRRKSERTEQKEDQNLNNGFGVFDENLGKENRPNNESHFEIYVDDETSDHSRDRDDERAFVFLHPKDHSGESSDEMDRNSPPRPKFREDTVVRRFVGSTVSDEPHVENVCHHGLVDPTINLKEAMDDINNMFGKPIDFVRSKRSKKQEKAQTKKEDACGFSIFEDGDVADHQQSQQVRRSPVKSNENNLHEPTVCMKEAMDDINKMFGMPLDF